MFISIEIGVNNPRCNKLFQIQKINAFAADIPDGEDTVDTPDRNSSGEQHVFKKPDKRLNKTSDNRLQNCKQEQHPKYRGWSEGRTYQYHRQGQAQPAHYIQPQKHRAWLMHAVAGMKLSAYARASHAKRT
jgi:hypothetical protein